MFMTVLHVFEIFQNKSFPIQTYVLIRLILYIYNYHNVFQFIPKNNMQHFDHKIR